MGSTTCRDGRTSQQFQGKVYGYHACGTPEITDYRCQQLLNGGGNSGGGNNNCGSWNNYCNGNGNGNNNNNNNNNCGSWHGYCNGNGNGNNNNNCGSWNNYCNGNGNNNNNNNCNYNNNYCVGGREAQLGRAPRSPPPGDSHPTKGQFHSRLPSNSFCILKS